MSTANEKSLLAFARGVRLLVVEDPEASDEQIAEALRGGRIVRIEDRQVKQVRDAVGRYSRSQLNARHGRLNALIEIIWTGPHPPRTAGGVPRKLARVDPGHLHKAKGHQGRPDRKTRAEKRAARKEPDRRAQQIDALIASTRRALEASPEEDGIAAGLFEALGNFYAPQLARVWGLADAPDAAIHEQAIAYMLRGLWGDQVTDLELDPDAYHAWRDRGRALAAG